MLDQGTRPQMAYFHRYSAGTDCMPPTAAAKYLACEDVRGRQNAVAGQRLPPLQDLVSEGGFSEFRWRSGIPAHEGLSNAPTAIFFISAAARTEPGPPADTVLDLLAA
jgi:hypothetical protein